MKKFHILTAGVFVLLVSGVFISNGFAGLVSSGSETLYSNSYDDGEDMYSFAVQVDYEVYDIGNGQYEARFQLEHLGAAETGHLSIDFGRFSVHTETPGDYLPYIGDPGSISDPSLVAPVEISSRSWWDDRAEYYFDPGYVADFGDEDVSEWLTLTFDAADMPQTVVIEADLSAWDHEAATTITLVPEPASLLLLAGGAVLLRRRKR